MLVRHDSRGVLVIGQPSHAWISGQLARVWGSERFGAVEPYEEVCLAAEQHDVGMAMWDLEPPRHTESGLPVSFLQMAIPDHIDLWTTGVPVATARSDLGVSLLARSGTNQRWDSAPWFDVGTGIRLEASFGSWRIGSGRS